MEKLRLLNKHRIVVTAQDYSSPINKLHILSAELERMDFVGEVIFDLLICNGLSSNRFIKIEFNGNSFISSSFIILNNIDPDLREEQDSFFLSHPNLLESSVLSKKEIIDFQIKRLS